MDEEFNEEKRESRNNEESNQEGRRRRSSIMSLDRMSGMSREPSLRNRPTLVQ